MIFSSLQVFHMLGAETSQLLALKLCSFSFGDLMGRLPPFAQDYLLRMWESEVHVTSALQ